MDSASTLAHELAISASGQDTLHRRVAPTFLQTAGGLYTVRGYPETFTSGDRAIFGTVEYRLHVPRLLSPGEPISAFGGDFRVRPQRWLGRPDWDLLLRTFFDVGRTVHVGRQSFENDNTLMGAGIGAELSVKRNFNLRVDWGFALRDAIRGTDKEDAGSQRLHFSITILY